MTGRERRGQEGTAETAEEGQGSGWGITQVGSLRSDMIVRWFYLDLTSLKSFRISRRPGVSVGFGFSESPSVRFGFRCPRDQSLDS